MRPVLVAEDDHEIREALEALLGEVGYQVLTAADGKQALELLRKHAGSPQFPSVLLLDLMMPVMNGWEVLNELRKDPALSLLPGRSRQSKGLPVWRAGLPEQELRARPPPGRLHQPTAPSDEGLVEQTPVPLRPSR